MRNESRNHHSMRAARALVMVTAALLATVTVAKAAAVHQKTFASPQAAVSALIDAAKADDTAALLAIFGPDGRTVIGSGDPVADRNARERFIERAGERTHLEEVGDDFAVLSAGNDDWPFPIPLVKERGGWRFDTAAGKQELLNRRIGRNELDTISVCEEYVAAQRDYARRAGVRGGIAEYAQRLRSTPGAHDGLYWETAAGEEESPMGPFLAVAAHEGYGHSRGATGPKPFHGYIYTILTAQGPHAPGGEKSYVDGHMSGGFGLVAYPVEYGASGIMTFVVNQDGVVFQKDLGPRTGAVASGMTRYDPDESWAPVE